MYIGVDLGGTKILIGLMTEKGQLLHSRRLPTQAQEGWERVLQRIKEAIEELCRERDLDPGAVRGFGLGSPGPLDLRRGLLLFAPNLGWRNVPLLHLLEERIGGQWFMENDALAAAWGEKILGAGQDHDDVLYCTVSTGIGGGVILQGRPYGGAWGGAGEVGHMVLNPEGPLCGCGNRGCFEALASGQALERRAREALAQGRGGEYLQQLQGEVMGAGITQGAREGDRVCVQIIADTAFYLGLGLRNLIHIFNPSLIILGGGVMEAFDLFKEPLEKGFREYLLPGFQDVVLLPARLGGEAGVLGAALLARYHIEGMYG